MRMIGIGLAAFFIALGVYLLSSQQLPQRGLRQISALALGPRLIFESEPDRQTSLHKKHAVFFRTTRNNPMILSGFPSYQSAPFLLPIDARATSGYLQIDITSQVLDGVKGIFRVSINNTKRGEMLLYPGEVERSMLVPLRAQELAHERLVASFSLVGSHDSQSCLTKNGVQAIVEIEATSGIFLNLDRELTSARDRLVASGGHMSVAWNHAMSDPMKSALITKAASFIKNGQNVQFSSDVASKPFSLGALKALEASLPRADLNPHSWPFYVAKDGANFGLRRFYKSTNWRVKYHANAFDQGTLPNRFNLDLAFAGAANKNGWMVSVTLNGKLIHTHMLMSHTGNYQQIIDLPLDAQTAQNVIEVTLDAADTYIGMCNEGPIFVAQMQDTSSLMAGTQIYDEALYKLRAALNANPTVKLSGLKSLTDHQVTVYAHILASIMPEKIELGAQSSHFEVQFVQRGQFLDDLKNLKTMTSSWLLFMNENDELQVHPVSRIKDQYPHLNGIYNAILVRPSETEV